MSPKQWLALFCFYISYLFFGASVFYHIEHELEAKRRAISLQHRIDINGNWFICFFIHLSYGIKSIAGIE